MVGNIVSGKSTWIKEFLAIEQRNNWIVLSKDDIRRMLGAGNYVWDENIEPIIHTCFIDMLGNFMQRNVNIILDETNMDRETRDVYLDFTEKRRGLLGYNYETIAVVMPFIPLDKMVGRIGYRINKPEWGNFPAEVWGAVWDRKNSKFEMPTKKEGFDEVLEIN